MNYKLEEIYAQYYGNYFPKASENIYNLLIENIKNKRCKILEIGCASGHISFKLALKGYNISGIEIRENIARETINKIEKADINFKIYIGDILQHNESYDFVWNSGLLQCFEDKEKYEFLKHIKKISKRAIFVVPQRNKIIKFKDPNSHAGVEGCMEYLTGNIPYILSQFYQRVVIGKFTKEELNLECDFIYYFCE